jgi:hypothetical protein
MIQAALLAEKKDVGSSGARLVPQAAKCRKCMCILSQHNNGVPPGDVCARFPLVSARGRIATTSVWSRASKKRRLSARQLPTKNIGAFAGGDERAPRLVLGLRPN